MLVYGVVLSAASIAADLSEANIRDFVLSKLNVPADAPAPSIEKVAGSDYYQIRIGPQIFFAHYQKGKILLGELYRSDTGVNIGNERMGRIAAERLSAYPPEKTLRIAKGNPKRYISVFTDIDCGYCRLLHRNIQAYLDAGVEVRYLLYPRAGLNSESADKARSAWCAKDRVEAITRAKRGEPIEDLDCDNPVAEHFRLGQELGLSGTPMIVLDNGVVIRGYLPPEQIIAQLFP